MLFFKKDKKDAKATADAFFTKGQWDKALESYEEAMAGSGKPDVKLVRKVADLRAKLGRTQGAVEAYRLAADLYAASGFLVQAIAIYKILLRLDPKAEDVAKKLSGLYAERGITGFRKDELAAEPGMAEEVAAGEMEYATEEPREPEVKKPLRAFKRIPLFSDLPQEAFVKVVEDLESHQIPSGQFVFKQGDPGTSIFVVASGSIDVKVGGKVLARLAEGDFFGEAALFSSEPRNADVIAGKDGAELLEIKKDRLEGLMNQYAGVSEALNLFYKKRITDRMLATSNLLDELDSNVREEFEGILEELEVQKGFELVKEGSDESVLYFVLGGRFSVTTKHPVTGNVIELATIGPGHFFGEVTLLTKAERTATVTALEKSHVLRVTWEAIEPYMERYPVVKKALEKARDERAESTVDIILRRKK